MKFRTEITPAFAFEFQPHLPVLTLGSCFADRMGTYLQELQLNCSVNPFGVIYNPVSLALLLERSTKAVSDKTSEWINYQNRFHNLHYHGTLSGDSLKSCEKQRQALHKSASQRLKKAGLLTITFGTSYAYRHIETGDIISNCHRFPASNFKRELLDIDAMLQKWVDLLQRVFQYNKELNIIFTVSPVRHVRDSLVENQLSKAQLSVLVHRLINKFPQAHYFPSYEIMMDDLRDYRFYDENLVQPNSQALNYIKEKFRDFCFNDEMHSYEKALTKLQKRLNHKIVNEDETSRNFQLENVTKIEDFRKRYPFTALKDGEQY